MINGKRYIGSSKYLYKRFREYYNINYLLRNTKMSICRALLKYGYQNFSLTIIEFCEPEKCLKRESYYIKLLKVEYNISKNLAAPY